jgi:hypothetical protein
MTASFYNATAFTSGVKHWRLFDWKLTGDLMVRNSGYGSEKKIPILPGKELLSSILLFRPVPVVCVLRRRF